MSTTLKKHGPGEDTALPEGFTAFFEPLDNNFSHRRRELLAARAEALRQAHAGKPPSYLPDSPAVTGPWKLKLPDWAKDQRNQITGPADNAKLLIGMCNSGDPGCMPDGEDSIVTDYEHVRAAHRHTALAIAGKLTYCDPTTGKSSAIKPSEQVVLYRPRGLLLEETHAFPGRLVSASIFDLAMVFFLTQDMRRAALQDSALQRRLCFYFPKSESAQEAQWWSDLLAAMEASIGIPEGTTKVMFLIESLPAAYQAEEILYAARRHVIGLNLGRWDYMASLLHFKLTDPSWILPDRNTIPHDISFFQNIRKRLVHVCHRRGALAIGGMTALFPDRADAQINARALERLAVDKKNEAVLGFDGAWTGHPDQCKGAIAQFPSTNQLQVLHPDFPLRPDLTPNPSGTGRVTLAGTRDAVRTVIEYRYGVLTGLGARLIKGYDAAGNLIGGFMEDLATDRIYRLMLAQRMRHQVKTEEGATVDLALVSKLFDSELAKIIAERTGDPESTARYREASRWSQDLIQELCVK